MNLPVHSPLLKQSPLLELPPLSDMLKFGGLLHVHQVFSQLADCPSAIKSRLQVLPTGSFAQAH